MFSPSYYPNYHEYIRAMTRHFNLDNPAPYISASAWCITDLDSNELYFARQENTIR